MMITLTEPTIVRSAEDGCTYYMHGIAMGGDDIEPRPDDSEARMQVEDGSITAAHFYAMERGDVTEYWVPDGSMEHRAVSVKQATETLREVIADLVGA